MAGYYMSKLGLTKNNFIDIYQNCGEKNEKQQIVLFLLNE